MNYKIRSDFCKWAEGVTEEAWTSRGTSMGTCSKSRRRLSLRNCVLLRAGQENTDHAARSRLPPRNLQPNTGKLEARASPGRKGSASATGRKRRAINTVVEAQRLLEDFGRWGVTGQLGQGGEGAACWAAEERGDRNEQWEGERKEVRAQYLSLTWIKKWVYVSPCYRSPVVVPLL